MKLKDLHNTFAIFAIDPSNTSCGWAVFDAEKETNTLELDKSGDIRSSGSNEYTAYLDSLDDVDIPVQGNLGKGLHIANDWLYKCDYMVVELHKKYVQYTEYDGVVVLIELPWGAGQRNVDDIMKLMCLVGMLRSHFERHAAHVVLAPVMSWKGQAKKDVTLKRMNRRWGLDLQKKDYDESDAIGIGTWYGMEILGLDSVV